MNRRRRQLLLGLALLPAGPFVLPRLALASTAERPPDGLYRYRLEHSDHGALGTHTIAIASDGDERRVTVERRLKVTRVLITVFREETDTEEVWRDGRMVSYRRVTDDGEESMLTAREEEGLLVVQGPEGRFELPLGTFPTHPWNPEIVEERLLMDTGSGRPVEVEILAAGEEEVVVGGLRLEAQRYEMTGGQRRSLWYDEAGRLLRMVIHREDGGGVTFALEALPA